MLMQGLLVEVWKLREQGLRVDCPAGRAIGYAECLAFFDQIEKDTDADHWVGRRKPRVC